MLKSALDLSPSFRTSEFNAQDAVGARSLDHRMPSNRHRASPSRPVLGEDAAPPDAGLDAETQVVAVDSALTSVGLPIALAVQNNLSVTDLAQTLSVYPSLSGSTVETARRLMSHDDLD